MTGFIHLTDKDGDPVTLKADSVVAIYRTPAEGGAFFAHGQQEPARTAVVSSAGAFTVTESHHEVLTLIQAAGAPA